MQRNALMAGLAILFLVTASVAEPQAGNVRQRYGPWEYSQAKGYHYRKYEYKVDPMDKTYQHEYCIYYKNDKKIGNDYVYMYNPQTQTYWCRYPTVNHKQYAAQAKAREEAWSVVPPAKRQKKQTDLAALPAGYFPPVNPKVCPQIPGSTDGMRMESPPPDLP